MVSPIKSITHALSNPIDTVSNMFSKAAPTLPDLPAPPIPGTAPTAKPSKKGMQQSFLSGVAASGLQGQSGSGTGKTLLGA